MKDKYLLGIDLGTTGVKSILFDMRGNALGVCYKEYELIFIGEYVEQKAELWWENVALTSREAMAQAGVAPEQVAGLSVSTQGIAGVLTDGNGVPLMNALSWLDNRSYEIALKIADHMGADVLFRHTGKNPGAYALPQLMWLKEHCRETYDRAVKYLLPLDFAMKCMTGRAVTDYSIACGTMGFDLREHVYMKELLDWAGIDETKFSEVGCVGDVVGPLLPEAAEKMGLAAGTPVVLGAQDQRCCAIGAGIGPGIATISLGTSSAMCMLTDSSKTDPLRHITLVSADENRYMTESVVGTSGAALKWFRNTVTPDLSYDQITALADTSPAGANGVLFYPDLVDPKHNGLAGCFIGLRLATTRADMARAVLEGISYSLVSALEDHERCVGACEQIRAFGGGANSSVWCQILADISGKPVALPATHETGCLGAAIIAAKGAGLLRDVFAPGDMLQAPSRVNVPDPAAHTLYNSYRARYKEVRKRLG